MKLTVLAAAGAAAVVAGGALVGVPSAAAEAGNPYHMRFTLVIQDAKATLTPPDFGARPAPNQQATEDAPVLRNGKRIGRAETVMTITRVAGADVAAMLECSLELPRGNILFNGSVHLADLARGAAVPVVGGTGDYAGLGGTVVARMASGPSTVLTFDVTRQ